MKSKKILLLAIAILTGFTSIAQDDNDKDNKSKKKSKISYVGGFGWGILTDWGTTKSFAAYELRNKWDPNTQQNKVDTTYLLVKRPLSFSLLTLGYNNHIIFKEFSNEKSLSINIYPTFGLSFARTKFLSFNLPVSINLNHGNVSTLRSKKDRGSTIGVGLEYINAGMISFIEEADFDNSLLVGGNNSIYNRIQPFVNAGFRYFNRNDVAKEVNLKFGMTSQKVLDVYNKMPSSEKVRTMPFWGKLTFIRYIGY